MSIEANKQIVRQFMAHLSANEFDAAFALLTEDMRWWVPSDQPGGTYRSKAEMRGTVDLFMGIFTQLPEMTEGRVTAEADRVALEQTSRGGQTNGGGTYGNDYHMLFQLRDGLISEIKEYMNPLIVAPLLPEIEAAAKAAAL